MDVLFLMSNFCLYPGLELSFKHNKVRKNLSLGASSRWDSRPSSGEIEMDHKFKWGGIIGYGNSFLKFLFYHFRVFRLHGILPDAAGAVLIHSGKGPEYCYMIGRGPTFCLLGHVTGLLFCLYVKLSLPSNFNYIDF